MHNRPIALISMALAALLGACSGPKAPRAQMVGTVIASPILPPDADAGMGAEMPQETAVGASAGSGGASAGTSGGAGVVASGSAGAGETGFAGVGANHDEPQVPPDAGADGASAEEPEPHEEPEDPEHPED